LSVRRLDGVRHSRFQQRLLWRVEEGRPAHCGIRSFYDRGGLALHAGCKVIPVGRAQSRRVDHRVIGHRQNDDDLHQAEQLVARVRMTFVALMRAAKIYATEERLFRQDLRFETKEMSRRFTGR